MTPHPDILPFKMNTKKLTLLFCLLICSLHLFGQKKELNNAKNYFDSYINALNKKHIDDTALIKSAGRAIDKASIHPKTIGLAQTLVLKGAIYAILARRNDTDQTLQLADTAESCLHSGVSSKKGMYDDYIYQNGIAQLSYALQNIAYKKYKESDFKNAFRYYERGYRLVPADTAAIRNAAVTAARLANIDTVYANRAVFYYRQLLSNPIVNSKQSVYLDLSSMYLALKDTAASRQLINEGYRRYPASPEFKERQIDLLITQRRMDEAITEAEETVHIFPRNANLFRNIGYAYLVKAFRINEAQYPTNPSLREKKQLYLLKATLAFKKTMQLDPGDAWTALRLASVSLDRANDAYTLAIGKPANSSQYLAAMTESARLFEEAYPYMIQASDLNPLSEVAQEYLKSYERGKVATAKYKSQPDAVQQNIKNGTKIDIIPPVLTLLSPKLNGDKRFEGDQDLITVSGLARDSSGIYKVTVNEKDARVNADGKFGINIPLVFGDNLIAVSALDGKMNRTDYQFHIYRESVVNFSPIPEPVAQQNIEPKGHYYALIICVQHYTDKAYTPLDYPIANAEHFAKVLREKYFFERKNIKILKDPTGEQLFNGLDSLTGKLRPADNVLIFYAGHGGWNEEQQQGYWFPADARHDRRHTWISNADIKDYIFSMRCKHVLLISDACFSGSIFKVRDGLTGASSAINDLYRLPSRQAITSGNLQNVPDNSIFIRYITRQLELNIEKYLPAMKLFYNIMEPVSRDSPNHQTPLAGAITGTDDQRGDFIFVRKD